MAKRRGKRIQAIVKGLAGLLLLVVLLAGGLRLRYGGGEPFPDRIEEEPTMAGDVLEVVAELSRPPGNVAVGPGGRIFFTFHPEGAGDTKVAELVDGEVAAYPSAAFQSERDGLWFDTPLSLRIDRQGRLWVLDHATHGMGEPKLVAIDLDTDEVVREEHFNDDQTGLGSHLNDFAVHPNGDRVYIADASIFAKTPALLIYDLGTGEVRRVLEGHESVQPEPYYIMVDGEPVEPFGLFAVRPGVDSIALDREAEWLYFAAVTATKMYRIRLADLDSTSLTDDRLGERVEVFGKKTLSDGITTDEAGRIYLTDPQHDAIIRMRPDASLEMLVSDPKLRWPDGFSFGPDGWLYVTCSALQHVIMQDREHVKRHAPYHILRFQPGASAPAGH